MKNLFAVVTAAFMVISACSIAGCGHSGNITSPTPPPEPPAPATFVVSGVVWVRTEAGDSPVEGAQIDVSDGASHHTAMTDPDGYYSTEPLAAGHWSVTVSKSGYETQTARLELENDVTLDFELQASGSSNSGGYRLRLKKRRYASRG